MDTEWHVRSNGLGLIILNQNSDVVAECRDETMAQYIVGLMMALADIARLDKDALSGLGDIARNALRD